MAQVDEKEKKQASITEDELNIIKTFDEQMEKLVQGKTNVDKVINTMYNLTTNDDFSNIAARLGLGSESLQEGGHYLLTRRTFDYQQTTAAYRNSWICRKGVNIPATDMHKLGVNITTEMKPEEVAKIDKELKKHRQKQIEGSRWGRLYGGAVSVIMIKDMMDKMAMDKEGNKRRVTEFPLDYESIDVDSFGGLYVLDRWNGVSPEGKLVTDEESYQYGKPEMYTINLPDQSSIRIHHSWLLIHDGIQLPRLERYADSYWGMSVLEPVFTELQKRDNTNYSVANLIFQSSLRVFKFKNFRQSVATGSKGFQEEMNRRMESLVKYQSNQSATIIDADDSFEVHSATFSGLDSILELFMEDIAGAWSIPMSKMYGREGKGFSGDDKSSARNYSEFIHAEQEEHERHNYDKLLRVICKSTLGMVPKDLEFDFVKHYDSDTETRRSQMEQEMTELARAYENGGIPRWMYLMELKEQGKDFDMFTNITPDYIKKTKEEEDLDPGEFDPDWEEDPKTTPKTKDSRWNPFKKKNK